MVQRPIVGLRPVRYVVAAAEEGSIRRAADRLGVHQSSVGRRIVELEQRLGVRLFERSHKGVLLTAAGREFVEGVKPALRRLDESVERAFVLGDGERNTLRVGLHAPLSGTFLSDLFRHFEATYPNVQVHLLDGEAQDHIAWLNSGELDIAFVSGIPEIEGLKVTPLWTERLFLLAPKSHPLASEDVVAWQDLLGERIIVAGHDPMVGGGAGASDLWLQIHADTAGLPVCVPASRDAPSVGAAVLAAHGAGYFSSIDEGISAMVRPGKRIEPRPREAALYDEIYQQYRALYPALKSVREQGGNAR
ncbi:LysR family transcriptional regulator [Mesorhizobium plurifarium]|uniref:LysR family transcriptional regulator n=1 Tax=Sinorhizobium arboris TaxID=76745 RepID=UPI00041C861F|nr:LysR family transcriptional regulator [Sinorhizobium arboris]PST17360.1 LysR family transcriptional regulator [Mesorhizobium plurifarium]